MNTNNEGVQFMGRVATSIGVSYGTGFAARMSTESNLLSGALTSMLHQVLDESQALQKMTVGNEPAYRVLRGLTFAVMRRGIAYFVELDQTSKKARGTQMAQLFLDAAVQSYPLPLLQDTIFGPQQSSSFA